MTPRIWRISLDRERQRIGLWYTRAPFCRFYPYKQARARHLYNLAHCLGFDTHQFGDGLHTVMQRKESTP